ncbi:hypothetical protein CMUS01_08001 [Colletotrichum musicola]|uniref:Glyoxalase/fosfomycin resistance/dioxygenase domain-containing protein n=1 Tax=Colletotrichum musicola TaxID=2175873 RepID=A0A8H6KFM4_9PEZI|nr:hypothetical protein CMUS01_08001 [Colletotrichum musicola]
MSTTHGRPINHVAVSVNDIDAVTKWYSETLGFQVIGNRIFHIKRSENSSAAIFAIYGEGLHEVKLAYMATGNGVGFEVFQFLDPGFKANSVDFEYNRGGFFHVCVTGPHPDAWLRRLSEAEEADRARRSRSREGRQLAYTSRIPGKCSRDLGLELRPHGNHGRGLIMMQVDSMGTSWA